MAIPSVISPLPAVFANPSLSAYTAVRSVVIIWNPHSGKRRAEGILATVKDVFEKESKEDVKLDTIKTEYAGHARDLARTIDISRYDALIIIGGDGSIHELINGLLTRDDRKLIPVGIIPGGTGNSLMTDLDCEGDVEEATRRILRGRHHPIDCGVVIYGADALTQANSNKRGFPEMDTFGKSWRLFFNIVHFGLSVDVNKRAEGMRILGGVRYNLASLYEVIRGKYSRQANIIIDGEPYNKFEDFCLLLLHNTMNTGKGMKFAPRAKLDDGQFDLIVCDALSRTTLLKFFGKIFDGSHVGEKGVDYVNVKESLIYSHPDGLENEEEIMINVDGENITGIKPPVLIRIIKGSFRIFV